MTIRTFAVLTVWLWVAGTSVAGDTIFVRLVAANNAPGAPPAALADVMGDLTKRSQYSNFQLVDSKKVKLPAAARVKLKGGYALELSGPKEKLKLGVFHGKRRIMQMTVSLKEGRPLILGEFPAQDGKMVFVLLSK